MFILRYGYIAFSFVRWPCLCFMSCGVLCRLVTCFLLPPSVCNTRCWGFNDHGQASPPQGHFMQVSSGHLYSCGIKVDEVVFYSWRHMKRILCCFNLLLCSLSLSISAIFFLGVCVIPCDGTRSTDIELSTLSRMRWLLLAVHLYLLAYNELFQKKHRY